MATPLQRFRDEYRETLLRFLWREWSALGVAGQEHVALHHVVDPEALVLFTCSLGRYDQRLFDEVMDWLTKNGRFLNIQRMRNILRKESFGGGSVLAAIADWLSQRDAPLKWKLLASTPNRQTKSQSLFFLPDSRPLPQRGKPEPTFLKHGFTRNTLQVRGYSQTFSPDAPACLFLKMRALFGVNARCDILTYLALNKTGHPREVARELYYSQKAIHDVMTEMACSGVVLSSRAARERTFRIAAGALPLLPPQTEVSGWINWPILLSTAKRVWTLAEELRTADLDSLVLSSEITLTMKPLLERLTRARWAPAISNAKSPQGIPQLRTFTSAFEIVAQ